jgi:GntR family transcriptional regulator
MSLAPSEASPQPASDLHPQTAPIPKYFRVKQAMLEQLAQGTWAPGAVIPSETELCQRFAVSRTTVRKAVSDLANEGRLTVVQGKGTFVATPKLEERFVQRAFGIHEDMARRGITLTTQVLRQEVTEASREVARRLDLRVGESVHLIVRLRFVEREPILLSTTYVPYSLCPDLTSQDLSRHSLYRLLRERYSLAISRGERRLEAVAAGAREARLLDIALGSPLLLLESVAYLAQGRPLEYSVALQRGDRTSVEVEFFASPEDVAGSVSRPPVLEKKADAIPAELSAESLANTARQGG